MLLQALAYQACDDMETTVTVLQTSLNLAEPHGFIRLFVDEGPPMAALLQRAGG